MHALAAQTFLILCNDLRLFWRDLMAAKGRVFSSTAFLGVVFGLANVMAILVCLAMKHPPALLSETVLWLLFAFIMLGAAMHHAIAVLFERADFDLLLSSPVSPRAILLARLSAMTLGAAFSAGAFLVPLLNGWTIGFSRHYAWGYLVWLLLAALVASAGVWFTLLLVRWLGPRRARTWSQVIAATLGALIYVGFQGQNLLPRDLRGEFANTMARVFEHPAFTLVARAGRGEGQALLTLTLASALVIAMTTRLLSRFFVTGIQEAGGIKPATRRHAGQYRFSAGLGRATFLKDLRLIARDPLLLSKVLPTVFYLLPILFSIGKFGGTGAPGILAPFAVLVAVSIPSTLTAVAAAGEEGWDLIRLSPASTLTLRLAKIAAGVALPLAGCIVIAIVIGGLGRPGLGVFSLVMSVLCATAIGWLEVAVIQPTPRKDVLQSRGRLGGRSAARLVAGAVFLVAGTGGAALASFQHWAWAFAALLVVVITALMCFTLVEMKDIEFEATPAPAR